MSARSLPQCQPTVRAVLVTATGGVRALVVPSRPVSVHVTCQPANRSFPVVGDFIEVMTTSGLALIPFVPK